MGYIGGYNPLTNHLLTSWDIQVGHPKQLESSCLAEFLVQEHRPRDATPRRRDAPSTGPCPVGRHKIMAI